MSRSDQDEASDESGREATAEAAKVAGGSGVVFAGNLVNRGIRLLVNWLLSNGLGATLYGLYELVRTIVTILAAFAPLGTDKGVTYFGATARQLGQRGRLKGVVQAAYATALIGGPVVAGVTALVVAFTDVASGEPGLKAALLWTLPAVVFWALTLAGVGTLRGVKAMKGLTVGYLLVLPAGMLLGSMIPLALKLGFDGGEPTFATLNAVLIGFGVANLLSAIVCGFFVWRRLSGLLRDPAIPAERQLPELYRYSLPESFSSMLFRVNQWTDTLMVGALATTNDLGLYRVAVTLAMIGELPAVAVNTMFQPVISEMVAAGDRAKLNRVVKIVTRWLVIIAAPVYLAIYVGQDVLLAAWKPEFQGAGAAVSILLWGQAAYVLAAPATALIPMSGRARLNLLNALAAASLNVGLNAWLIPKMGIAGAATATGITLAAWSLWRLVQIKWLMNAQAFSGRAIFLIGVWLALGFGLRFASQDEALMVQFGTTVGSVVAFLLIAAAFGRTPQDDEVLGSVKAKLKRKFGRS